MFSSSGGDGDSEKPRAAAAVAGVGGGGTGLGVLASKMSFLWANFLFYLFSAGGAIAVSLLSQESRE